MERLLEGKVALITGAGSGIGRATAIKFAAAGAKVVAVDITRLAVEETADMLRTACAEVRPVIADVALSADVEAAVGEAVSSFGRLDCAFNNAGIATAPDDRDEWDEEWFDRVMAINTKGVMLGMKFQIRQMLLQKSGTIVNTSSVAGFSGIGPLAYIASKHAVIGLTRAAAVRVAADGIRVNAICPGGVVTPMTDPGEARNPGSRARFLEGVPAARMGQASEIGDAVVWLCSPMSTYLVGHALVIDGGLTLG